MSPLFPAAVLVLLGVAVHGAAVKEKAASGYGAQEPAYYPQDPLPQPNYVQVPVFVPPPRPYLVHTHICARDVGYTTYGGKQHRSRRPTEHSCDDVFMPHDTNSQKKAAMLNCDRCCKSTARLNGFSTNDVHGFITIVDERRHCTCCAPALPTAPFSYGLPYGQPSFGYGAVPQSPVNYSPPQQTPIGYGAVPAAGDVAQPAQTAAAAPVTGY